MQRSVRGLIPLLALLLMAGCAPAVDAGARPSPSPSELPATAAPSPTATESSRVDPVRLFGGDCAAMLEPETLDALLGEGWKDYDQWLSEEGPRIPDRFRAAPEGTLGGLECRWKAPDESASGLFDLRVLALPADAVPADFADAFASPSCDSSYDALVCRLLRVDGDVAILAATLAESEEDTHEEALRRGIDEVAASAREQGVSAAPVVRTDAWSAGPSCDEMGESLADLTGGTFVEGYWEGSEQPEQALFEQTGVARECPWFNDSDAHPESEPFRIFSVISYPGGQWMWSDLTDGATPVDVGGAAEAASFANADDETGDLYVTDGVNIVVVSGEDVAFNSDVAERVLAAG